MIKTLLMYITGDVLVKGLGFLTLPLYSYLILPSEYGVLGLLNAIVAFLPVVLTLGYLNGFVRFFTDFDEEVIVSTFVYLGLILNGLYFVVAMLLYQFFIYTFDVKFFYFLISIITSVSIFLFHILLVYYRSKSFAKYYMKASVSYSLFGIGLNFFFLTILEDNVLAMLLANLTNALVVSVVSLSILKGFIQWKQVNWILAKDILRFTIPLALGAIGLLVFSQADKIVLANYVSKDELGVYTLAFSIALAVSYLGNAFFMTYQPLFFKQVEENSKKIIENYWKIILFILLSMFITFVVILTIYQLIDVRYTKGMNVAFIITMAYTFLIFAQIMELHLSYIKKTTIVPIVFGLGGGVSYIGLLFFVPKFGIVGASYALLFGGFFISILMYFSAQKYFYLAYPKKIVLGFYSIMAFLIWIIL